MATRRIVAFCSAKVALPSADYLEEVDLSKRAACLSHSPKQSELRFPKNSLERDEVRSWIEMPSQA